MEGSFIKVGVYAPVEDVVWAYYERGTAAVGILDLSTANSRPRSPIYTAVDIGGLHAADYNHALLDETH